MQNLFLKQKVFSLTEDFTFFDLNQVPVFRAKGNFFAFPKRYKMFDSRNNAELMEITRKFFAFVPTFSVTDTQTGQQVLTVRQRFRLGRPKFDISTPHGNYLIEGNFIAHTFKIFAPNGQQIIEVKKRLISWGDTYEITVDTSQIPLTVAAAIILTIDCALHSSNR